MGSTTLVVVSIYLWAVPGVGIGGQQVVGIVDALHEAVGAGYPDDPSTQVAFDDLSISLKGCVPNDPSDSIQAFIRLLGIW
jgi:hypothetical protein